LALQENPEEDFDQTEFLAKFDDANPEIEVFIS